MRRRSFRFSIAIILVVGGCAAALAYVSGINAGAVTGAQFDIFAQPQALTVNGTGFVKAVYTAPPSSAGTGSATHVKITIDLPRGFAFNQSASSSGCSGSASVICTVGTVNAGVTISRFVTFKAPEAVPVPPEQPIYGTVSWDNGTGGKGGGGGSVNSKSATTQTTIYALFDTSHSGSCFFNGGTVSTPTPDPKTTDNQNTSANVGIADPSLGIPCAYADVGEDPIPNAGFVTAMSHDNIAKLIGPAMITIKLDPLPVSFDKIAWRYFPDYDPALPPTNILQGTPIGPCTPDGTLPSGKDVCLLTVGPFSPVKSGNSGTWTFLQNGTGSDPGFGS